MLIRHEFRVPGIAMDLTAAYSRQVRTAPNASHGVVHSNLEALQPTTLALQLPI